ncbi:YbfB/YjiJ family MFS transporter [Polymorphum gilvum]|uniref:Putative transmembrane MFS permease protein n=1 Tax=Polymorphum gilvum (strain LMG 25793 / CGMCC 1.9160 / SL003B-26A1) TaxID=991905 RepID=F2IV69_POLGS|nr:YbfB/YjiJ family MFS transporter [Polymorphum gilvum]ADZ71400.1 Putative transmembrane MFS permease protein [Polymorphum gilvum SL003B-26A1]
MPDTAASRPVPTALGGLLALAAAMGIGRFVYTPILPYMAEGVPLDPAAAGLIASANFFGYLVGALAASVGTLPGGRRRWLLGALLLSAATTAGMGAAGGMSAFLLLRFLGGVASAFVLVFSSAIVLDRVAAAGRPGLSALHFSGVGGGIALTAVLVAALAAAGVDWRGQWYASGAATLACLLAATLLVPATPDTAAGSGADGHRSKAPLSAPLLRLIVAYGLYGFGYVITATFISVIVRTSSDLRPVEPYVWLAVGLSAAPSILAWNRVAARIGAAQAFAFACVLEALGVGLSVIEAGIANILLAAVLLGGTFVGIAALGLVEARRQATGDPRRVLAVMTASFGLGQMVGPWLAGLGAELTGSFVLPSLAAAVALLVASALVLVPARTAP